MENMWKFTAEPKPASRLASHTKAKGKDFIIYETLMLQLEAHKINDAVSFISSNEQCLNYTEESCKR